MFFRGLKKIVFAIMARQAHTLQWGSYPRCAYSDILIFFRNMLYPPVKEKRS